VPCLSASEVMIHEEVLYKVCVVRTFTFYKVGLLHKRLWWMTVMWMLMIIYVCRSLEVTVEGLTT